MALSPDFAVTTSLPQKRPVAIRRARAFQRKTNREDGNFSLKITLL
jgi:hypothetical protein